MKKCFIFALCFALGASCATAAKTENEKMDHFVSKLMKKMTMEEKIGQLNFATGGVPVVGKHNIEQNDAIRNGLIGATGGFDPVTSREAQEIAVRESRLKIPLLVGLDVIHGYETIFPIPLASSCSWNMDLIRRSAEIAAAEASAYGVNWTFSPMVDICRDPRWGRIAEGAGEDPFLGSRIAEEMVRGYQGTNLAADTTLLACIKHFALYGASEAGRDYNTVDMSRVYMHNYYLPPYKAASDAGAGSLMTSFNTVDGIPSSGNKWLLTDLLRDDWGFGGFVVSDASAVGEMEVHGMGNRKEIAALGLNAGTDMDLGASVYITQVKQAIKEGLIDEKTLDASCRRILEAKYKLGLFDDPFKYFSEEKKQKTECLEYRTAARQLAAESIVLLKNDDNLLPLKKSGKIAVVGPLGNNSSQLLGTWTVMLNGKYRKTIAEAIKEAVGSKGKVEFAQGANFTEDWCLCDGSYSTPTDSLVKDAVRAAEDADVVIAAVGEPSSWSGEAHCRTDISIPDCQKKLLAELKKTGKPVVLVVISGRPLALQEEDKQFSTILEAWHGGTMAAEALADVIFGDVNPSGKLTATFPRNVGQIPIYYNALNTGRPLVQNIAPTTRYIDLPDNSPLYPFGYGLSYTNFIYSNISIDKKFLKGDDDKLTASVTILNNGKRDGKETVQLYIGDPAARISRPVIELKGFEKVLIPAGESRTVEFVITPELLKYFDSEGNYGWDGGDFNIGIGPNSADLKKATVTWDK